MSSPRRLAAALVVTATLTMACSPALAGATSTTTTTSPPGPTQVLVSSFSEKGDFISRGVSSVYSSHWATVSATTTGIVLVYRNPASHAVASYHFAPVAGQELTVGDYPNVQRAETRSAGFAGIDVTGAGEPAGWIVSAKP